MYKNIQIVNFFFKNVMKSKQKFIFAIFHVFSQFQISVIFSRYYKSRDLIFNRIYFIFKRDRRPPPPKYGPGSHIHLRINARNIKCNSHNGLKFLPVSIVIICFPICYRYEVVEPQTR